MKNIFKRLFVSLISVIVIASCMTFTSSAAGSSISLSKSSLTIGDSITVTVTINAGTAMYGAEFSLGYDANVLKFMSGDSASGGAGTVKVVDGADGETKKSFSMTFTAVGAGTSSIAVSGAQYAADTEVSVTGSSVNITVANQAASANANLSAFKVSNGTLTPKFSPNITSYRVSVPFSVTQCKFYATAADGDAKIKATGSSNIPVGDTTRVITVTAPSGATKNYTVVITRLAENASSSEAQPAETQPAANTAVIGNKSYTVMPDITGITIPFGFCTSTAVYNGTDVAVIKDENQEYEIYYLKAENEEAPKLFTFNQDTNEFEPLEYTLVGEKMYIFTELESKTDAPKNYYVSTVQINGYTVKCYGINNQKMSDFYILRCYVDGKYGYYRYDSTEGVFQREPDFTAKEISATVSASNENLIVRFKKVSTTGRIIVCCTIVAVLAVIAIIVLFVIKFLKGRKSSQNAADGKGNDAFDDVTVQDTFVLSKEDRKISDKLEDRPDENEK